MLNKKDIHISDDLILNFLRGCLDDRARLIIEEKCTNDSLFKKRVDWHSFMLSGFQELSRESGDNNSSMELLQKLKSIHQNDTTRKRRFISVALLAASILFFLFATICGHYQSLIKIDNTHGQRLSTFVINNDSTICSRFHIYNSSNIFHENKLPEFARISSDSAFIAISLTKPLEEIELSEFIQQYHVNIRYLYMGKNKLFASLPIQQIKEITEDSRVELAQALPAQNIPYTITDPKDEQNNLPAQSHPSMAIDFNNKQNKVLCSNKVTPLNGKGVTIGVGDFTSISQHFDFKDKYPLYFQNQSPQKHHIQNIVDHVNFANHAAHVAHVIGTLKGSGKLNESVAGIAPESRLLLSNTFDIIIQAKELHEQHGMVLTNNSYGSAFTGTQTSDMNTFTEVIDHQLHSMPELLHVFAAGNSGSGTCSPYPEGYKTVLSYYQAAKNVLTVGSVDFQSNIMAESSKGPTMDGRIKPEICSRGTSRLTPDSSNYYQTTKGTSMSAPSVTGVLALLQQRYRQLNDEERPDGALLKAIACNTADDLGKSGPDYFYGFGLLNAKRALEAIDQKTYFKGSISTKEVHVFETPVIPTGVHQIKIMLYWADKENKHGMYDTKSLINDLDLEVMGPDNEVYLPWILDASNPNQPAVRSKDSFNNIEQITIDTPTPGKYTFRIIGHHVPYGPQTFHITYSTKEGRVTLNSSNNDSKESYSLLSYNKFTFSLPSEDDSISKTFNLGLQ